MATVALVACNGGSLSAPPGGGRRPTASAPATTSTTLRTVTLTASLSGAAEVPGPGGDGASGAVRVVLDPDAGQVCFDLTVAGVDTPTAAHLHAGPLEVVGPVSVTLAPPVAGRAAGCVAAEPDLVASIVANPGGFYVDVHSDAYRLGAVRGQLSR